MVAEYYYNPNTNKTFTKDSAQKIAVPEGFSSVTEDVYQGYVNQGVQPAGVVGSVKDPNITINPNIPQMSDGMVIPQPPTRPGTADPSQFIQGQVGAGVRQPTLPTGTSVGQQLQLQQETPGTVQPTSGLTGTPQVVTPTAQTAPTITPATLKSFSSVVH